MKTVFNKGKAAVFGVGSVYVSASALPFLPTFTGFSGWTYNSPVWMRLGEKWDNATPVEKAIYELMDYCLSNPKAGRTMLRKKRHQLAEKHKINRMELFQGKLKTNILIMQVKGAVIDEKFIRKMFSRNAYGPSGNSGKGKGGY